MAISDIAVSRNLTKAGFDKEQADALAEAIATHANNLFMTKAGVARLDTNLNIAIALNAAVLIAFIASATAFLLGKL